MQKRLDELNEAERYQLEKYNREVAKLRLLEEIKFSLTVCELEGWDKKEFIQDLQNLINNIKI